MMNFKLSNVILAVLSTAIFFQCNSKNTNNDYPKTHFDVSGILENQIEHLNKSGARLSKKVEFDNEKADLVLDSVDWAKELRLFKTLNINKPALAPLYDSSINGNSIIYQLKEDGNNSELKSLEIKRNDKNELIQISGNIEEDNYLYKSQKELILYFDEGDQNLKGYDLNVSTEVIFRDKENSIVHGEVIN